MEGIVLLEADAHAVTGDEHHLLAPVEFYVNQRVARFDGDGNDASLAHWQPASAVFFTALLR
jgi:hypothetical protein